MDGCPLIKNKKNKISLESSGACLTTFLGSEKNMGRDKLLDQKWVKSTLGPKPFQM